MGFFCLYAIKMRIKRKKKEQRKIITMLLQNDIKVRRCRKYFTSLGSLIVIARYVSNSEHHDIYINTLL